MKINYKVIAIVLAVLLALVLIIHWEDIFSHSRRFNEKRDGDMMMNMRDARGNKMVMNGDGSNKNMSMDSMLVMMEGKTGKALEKEFITGMIPHHQLAVDMAKKLLADPTVNEELKNFANQIITAQEGEIQIMEGWLKNY